MSALARAGRGFRAPGRRRFTRVAAWSRDTSRDSLRNELEALEQKKEMLRQMKTPRLPRRLASRRRPVLCGSPSFCSSSSFSLMSTRSDLITSRSRANTLM
jgi:hypothetical protein